MHTHVCLSIYHMFYQFCSFIGPWVIQYCIVLSLVLKTIEKKRVLLTLNGLLIFPLGILRQDPCLIYNISLVFIFIPLTQKFLLWFCLCLHNTLISYMAQLLQAHVHAFKWEISSAILLSLIHDFLGPVSLAEIVASIHLTTNLTSLSGPGACLSHIC